MVCVAVLAAATLSSCSAIGMGDAFIVASTNFSETRIIANMYQQVLAAHGVDARVKELTTREIIAPALQKGELQATPEYLGSFTEYLNKKTNGPDAPAGRQREHPADPPGWAGSGRAAPDHPADAVSRAGSERFRRDR